MKMPSIWDAVYLAFLGVLFAYMVEILAQGLGVEVPFISVPVAGAM